ncbi:MAG: hypothetical protein NTX97_06195 [Bacteroidetes bacterium]|nr:hypothetical protein [Bacteroidota bacterium]
MENKVNNRIHEIVDNWMQKLDHFQLELSLGKMEVKDEYAEQKKILHDYLHKYIQSADHFKDYSKEKARSIKNSLNELKKEFLKEEETTELTIKEHKKSVGIALKKIGTT